MKFAKFLVIAMLLVFTLNANGAKKPDSTDCPCYLSDPGLVSEVTIIRNETCVETLERERVVIANNARNWYLEALTLTADPCFEMHIQESLQSENKYCFIRSGYMSEQGYCSSDGGTTWGLDLSDKQYDACEYALKDAYRYLESMTMCE